MKMRELINIMSESIDDIPGSVVEASSLYYSMQVSMMSGGERRKLKWWPAFHKAAESVGTYDIRNLSPEKQQQADEVYKSDLNSGSRSTQPRLEF